VGTASADPEAVGLEPVLLGRDQELAHLYGMIDRIETRGDALVVRGEAGIGKSALLASAG
jgi:predicted ATPase